MIRKIIDWLLSPLEKFLNGGQGITLYEFTCEVCGKETVDEDPNVCSDCIIKQFNQRNK